jgi:uncharacterized protein YacL
MAREQKVQKEEQQSPDRSSVSYFSPKMIGLLADEVAKRLPNVLTYPRRRVKGKVKTKKLENALFLDTSAIIDGRIFDVVNLGLLNGEIVILESILLELKHIADLQDTVKRERGRNGLNALEKLKKAKLLKVVLVSDAEEEKYSDKHNKEVDEKLILAAKYNKGKIITCDYNLAKKATIQGVLAINVNEVANSLKIRAVPGEAIHVKVLHQGKDSSQGVGYLDDGTMIVVENGVSELGKSIDVVVSRVIQTSAGRILFAKKI